MPEHPEILACGDAVAVPVLTRPAQVTVMSAQHAGRQGREAAHNVAAAYRQGHRRAYGHHLGFVVDLAGARAPADPLGIPLSTLRPRW